MVKCNFCNCAGPRTLQVEGFSTMQPNWQTPYVHLADQYASQDETSSAEFLADAFISCANTIYRACTILIEQNPFRSRITSLNLSIQGRHFVETISHSNSTIVIRGVAVLRNVNVTHYPTMRAVLKTYCFFSQKVHKLRNLHERM